MSDLADLALPKIKHRTAVVSGLNMLTKVALLLSVAGSPLVQAASTENTPECYPLRSANPFPTDNTAQSLATGDATNSVDVAASIARSAATGAINNLYPCQGSIVINLSDDRQAGN